MSNELTPLSPPAGISTDTGGNVVLLGTGAPEGSDAWCVGYWLKTCARKSVHTRRAYRREAGRWLAFLAHTRAANPPDEDLLLQARYVDVQRYVSWIQGEDLFDLHEWAAKRWGVSSSQPKPTPTVLRAATVILHGMYEELAGAMVGEPPRAVLVLNPFKPFRRQEEADEDGEGAIESEDIEASGVAKALSDQAWALLWEAACEPPATVRNANDLRIAARRRLALAALRATWERRAAVAKLVWADLDCDREGVWKLRRKRKGKSKAKWEPVPEAFIREITLFRTTCGLPPTSSDDEKKRSIYWVGGRVGREGPISDDTLYRDIKTLLERAAAKVDQLGLDKAKADKLKEELAGAGRGPHSIRHTMATQFMAAGGQARRAQKILGHSSIAVTTRVYDTKTARETADTLADQWERSGSRSGDKSQQETSNDAQPD
jgi:integrase